MLPWEDAAPAAAAWAASGLVSPLAAATAHLGAPASISRVTFITAKPKNLPSTTPLLRSPGWDCKQGRAAIAGRSGDQLFLGTALGRNMEGTHHAENQKQI